MIVMDYVSYRWILDLSSHKIKW